MVAQGYQLIVVGESGHPEVEGILGHAGGAAFVVSNVEDLDSIDLCRRVGVVVQTTQTPERLAQIVSALVPRVAEVNVINTICKATHERQASAADLARRADVMVVVGGKNSGNTRRLAQICSERCASTHHIEDDAEIDPAWFEGVSLIGITAGASTPAAHIEQARSVIARAVGL